MVPMHGDDDLWIARIARRIAQEEALSRHRERLGTMLTWTALAILWWVPLAVGYAMKLTLDGAPYEAYGEHIYDFTVLVMVGISLKLTGAILTFAGCADYVNEQMYQLKAYEAHWRGTDDLEDVDITPYQTRWLPEDWS